MMGSRAASRTFLSSVSIAALKSSKFLFWMAWNTSMSRPTTWKSIFGLPRSATILLMNSMIFLISTCAVLMAVSMVSSSTSLAPASIITILSMVAATVRARSLTLRCSWVGFSTISPSTKPTCTPPMGPFHGISDTAVTREAPIIPAISGLQSGSRLMTVMVMHTSLRISLGNSGRMGRSTTRLVRMARSPGRPSRRIKLPGMRPAA